MNEARFLKQKLTKPQKERKMGIKGKNDRMVVLACENCKERNYTTTKNKKTLKEQSWRAMRRILQCRLYSACRRFCL